MAKYNVYSVEQKHFLKDNAPCMSRAELTSAFNKQFGTKKSILAIKSYCIARGWKSNNDGRFKKGNISWQTGIRGDQFKSHFTKESYKRMRRKVSDANKTRKIGDEVIIDGQPWIVVSLDYSKPFHERRMPKRRYIWEKTHGVIPKDCCIINLDRDYLNCNIDNLYCLPIRYRTLLAKNGWWSTDPEITLTAIKWCELYYAIVDVHKEDT